MGLINRVDGDGDLRPEDPLLCAVGRDAVDGCQRVRGDHRAPPSDHVAVVVVVRGLDQNKLELLGRHGKHPSTKDFVRLMRGTLPWPTNTNTSGPACKTPGRLALWRSTHMTDASVCSMLPFHTLSIPRGFLDLRGFLGWCR